MTEHERPLTDRRSRLKRQLAANAYWGIDSNSHCHDADTSSTFEPVEASEGDDGYVVSFDMETGEITTIPSSE
jgi:hypothetical protein